MYVKHTAVQKGAVAIFFFKRTKRIDRSASRLRALQAPPSRPPALTRAPNTHSNSVRRQQHALVATSVVLQKGGEIQKPSGRRIPHGLKRAPDLRSAARKLAVWSALSVGMWNLLFSRLQFTAQFLMDTYPSISNAYPMHIQAYPSIASYLRV